MSVLKVFLKTVGVRTHPVDAAALERVAQPPLDLRPQRLQVPRVAAQQLHQPRALTRQAPVAHSTGARADTGLERNVDSDRLRAHQLSNFNAQSWSIWSTEVGKGEFLSSIATVSHISLRPLQGHSHVASGPLLCVRLGGLRLDRLHLGPAPAAQLRVGRLLNVCPRRRHRPLLQVKKCDPCF